MNHMREKKKLYTLTVRYTYTYLQHGLVTESLYWAELNLATGPFAKM
jgi:hypothetical protein